MFPEGVLCKRLNLTTGMSNLQSARNICENHFNSWLPVSYASNWSKVALKAIMQPADVFYIGIQKLNFWSTGLFYYTDEGWYKGSILSIASDQRSFNILSILNNKINATLSFFCFFSFPSGAYGIKSFLLARC